MLKIIEHRNKAQKERFDIAHYYIKRLSSYICPLTAIVYGSSARGDFKDCSDIDIVIVADNLPADPMERLDLLYEPTEGLIEPKGFTIDEFKIILNKPFGQLLIAEGVLIKDDFNLFNKIDKKV